MLAGLLAAAGCAAGEPPTTKDPAAVHPDRVTGPHRVALNYRSDPLDLVLDYLSQNGGFIINKETDGPALVDLGGQDLVGWERALESLTADLKKSGRALIREGRILTLTSLERGKTSDLDFFSGNNPDAMSKSAEVITQLIPVRYASASQLVNNLQTLLPANTSLSVNESANTILLVASKTDVRRAMKIVAALDSALARVSSIQVIRLHYADAKQLAALAQQLFASQTTGANAADSNPNSPGMSGPGGGFGPPGAPGGAGSDTVTQSGGNSSGRGQVIATADEESNALIVSAPEGVISTVASLAQQLDRPVSDVTELRIFRLRNADPSELAEQLLQLFPDGQSNSGQDQSASRFGGMSGPPDMQDNDSSGGSASTLKKDRLLAAPDPRTSSLLVSAPATRMPVIARLIAELDASSARKEVVKTWELRNADPHNVNQALQDLFNRASGSRSNNSQNRNSLLGDNNPLVARATKQQSASSSSGFGSSGSGGGAGGAGGSGGAGSSPP